MNSLSRIHALRISGPTDLRTSVSRECPGGIISHRMPKLQIGIHHLCKKHRITLPLLVFGTALVLVGCSALQLTPMDIEDHPYPSDMMISRQTDGYSELEELQGIVHSIDGPAVDLLKPNPDISTVGYRDQRLLVRETYVQSMRQTLRPVLVRSQSIIVSDRDRFYPVSEVGANHRATIIHGDRPNTAHYRDYARGIEDPEISIRKERFARRLIFINTRRNGVLWTMPIAREAPLKYDYKESDE